MERCCSERAVALKEESGALMEHSLEAWRKIIKSGEDEAFIFQ
jgi:hypothetical protein